MTSIRTEPGFSILRHAEVAAGSTDGGAEACAGKRRSRTWRWRWREGEGGAWCGVVTKGNMAQTVGADAIAIAGHGHVKIGHSLCTLPTGYDDQNRSVALFPSRPTGAHDRGRTFECILRVLYASSPWPLVFW